MDKNKKTTEDDLEEKDVIIGAEEADDEIEATQAAKRAKKES